MSQKNYRIWNTIPMVAILLVCFSSALVRGACESDFGYCMRQIVKCFPNDNRELNECKHELVGGAMRYFKIIEFYPIDWCVATNTQEGLYPRQYMCGRDADQPTVICAKVRIWPTAATTCDDFGFDYEVFFVAPRACGMRCEYVV